MTVYKPIQDEAFIAAAVALALRVGEDPQAAANGYLPEVERDGTRFTLVASPVRFDDTSPSLRPAPDLGQHTEEVLLALGLTWEELAACKEAGAIS